MLQAAARAPCWEAAFLPSAPSLPTAGCMAWLSSNTITPSKSEPNQARSC